ncbi:MAG: GTPase ObgE [Candidatus Cloacimonetes bacterium]|nr:GTPase ObgE [Candidatus Cloacimonadota bacterium]
MFIDETTVKIKAGAGGNGMVSYIKSRHKAFKGPDGGTGGKGGDVYVVTKSTINSLSRFRYSKHKYAENGEAGKKRADGRKAPDLILEVPTGTCILNLQGEIIADLHTDGMKILLAKGGIGGKGNRALITKNNTYPQYCEKGQPGQEFEVRFELKMCADVGIIGFPNVGKSTFIAKVSNAKPKIADYPFTTLVPNLGMVPINDLDSILMADIPGIIEGAHTGQGLGHQFLRHIERTGFLLHMIDLFPYDGRDAFENFVKVNDELQKYSEKLANKMQIIALNKADMPDAQESHLEFESKLREAGFKEEIHLISALTGEGTKELVYRIAELLKEFPPQQEVFQVEYQAPKDKPLKIRMDMDMGWFISGTDIERVVAMTNFEQEQSVQRLQAIMTSMGIVEYLREHGAEDGDPLFVGDICFDFIDDSFESMFAQYGDEDDTDRLEDE